MHYPVMTCALFDYEHLVVWTRLCAIIVVLLDISSGRKERRKGAMHYANGICFVLDGWIKGDVIWRKLAL